MNSQTITGHELINLLETMNNKGAKIAYIVRQTDVKMNKKHRGTKAANPYTAGVTKVTGLTFCFGADYTNATNKELAKLGEPTDFKAGALWPAKQPDGTYKGQGEHVGPYTVRHIGTGALYFFGKPAQENLEVKASYSFMIDNATGKVVTKAELEPYMTPEQDKGLMIWHIYKLDSIAELTYGGTIYSRKDVQKIEMPAAA